MIRFLSLIFISIILYSCNVSPRSDRDYDKFDPNKIYKLKLDPSFGSAYHYEITNESHTEVELNGNKTDKETKTTVGVGFKIGKDSIGDFLFKISYDKVHLYSKKGDEEVEADASNATGSLNPVERMLGLLKESSMTAKVTPSGEIRNIGGYEDLGDKVISMVDPGAREIARAQWEKQIGDNLVKNNLGQLFKVFPDSSVHQRDSWKITSTSEGEIPLLLKSVFTLKAINNDIAVIAVETNITGDKTASTTMGTNAVSADLKGSQEGEIEMETKTGMLISSKMDANISGTMTVMGKEVPLKIKTSVNISGRKL